MAGSIWSRTKTAALFLVANWFIIGNAVAVVLAWRWPDVARTGGIIKSEYTVQYGCIGAIFLITGLTLSTPALWRQARNYRLHIITQGTSFLIYPSVTFALLNIIKAAKDPQIDMYILVGLQYVGCACTSIASNISMTIAGGGNGEAATVEVVLGNFMGVLLSPLLNQMYFSTNGWHEGIPIAENGQPGLAGLGEMYRRVMMKLGLAMFVPFTVGQVLQNFFPKAVKRTAALLHLPKVSSFLLIFLIWSVFSTQFANDAFSSIPPGSVALAVGLIIILYLGFSLLGGIIARLPFLHPSFGVLSGPGPSDDQPERLSTLGKGVRAYRLTKGETTAVCYCAAAKGLAVGTPMLEILYGGLGARERAIISIPFALYQLEQVIMAQVLSHVFKRWNAKPDPYFPQIDEPPDPDLDQNRSASEHEMSSTSESVMVDHAKV